MTNNENTELKPCPFCESDSIDPEGIASFKPEYRGVDGLTWKTKKTHMIEHKPACNECGATTNGEWNTRATDTENAKLRELVRLKDEALLECADDLEVEVKDRWINDGKIHPALMHKFKRDMSSVLAARKALKLTIDDVEV